MPLSLSEAVADIAPVLSFVDTAEKAISALPAKDVAKPSDYIKMASAILAAAAPIADTIAEQIKS